MRLRITFAKTEAMRYTGHLDLHRTWERTLRRAGLSLAYSQGFRPHPRIVLASALPLGCTSQCEVVDVWLEEQLPLERITAALQESAPPGLQVLLVTEADPAGPALPTQLAAAEFQITFRSPLLDLDNRLEQLLHASELPRVWREKAYDLRPLIFAIRRLPDDEHGCQQITVTLAAREGRTGRPEEVVKSLGGESEKSLIHRTRLIFESAD